MVGPQLHQHAATSVAEQPTSLSKVRYSGARARRKSGASNIASGARTPTPWCCRAETIGRATPPLSTVAGPIMVSRDDLKALIDLLPESRLEMVRTMLDHNVNPPPPKPEIEEMQRRSRNYRSRVEEASARRVSLGRSAAWAVAGLQACTRALLMADTAFHTGTTRLLSNRPCNHSMGMNSKSWNGYRSRMIARSFPAFSNYPVAATPSATPMIFQLRTVGENAVPFQRTKLR
jgi:hypothetical protein